MLKQRPLFLRLRERVYYFRYQLPERLRIPAGCRELVWSLQTSDKHVAMTLARWAAGKAVLIFMTISDKTPSELAAEIELLRHELSQAAAEAELQRVVARQRLKYANAKAAEAHEDSVAAARIPAARSHD